MVLLAERDRPYRALPVIHSRIDVAVVLDVRLSSVGRNLASEADRFTWSSIHSCVSG